MAKKLTKSDIAKIKKIGEVKFDPEPQEIAQFSELIEKLNDLISMHAKRTQADLARSQVQLEVLGALQKSVTQQKRGVTKSQQIDLTPLATILAEIQTANAEREAVSYEAIIHRSAEGGPMHSFTISPIQPTRH